MELSIALVILGLLVGGVLSGQSLIRAAELRAITAEYQKYATAENSFKAKYFGLPGDITNATAFWGHHGGSYCVNNSGTATDNGYEMCDGDGDGIITHNAYDNENSEAFQGWTQLAHAGLIQGTYTGISGPSSAMFGAVTYIIGQNAPASRIANAGWALTYLDNRTGFAATPYRHNYLNWMTVGGSDGSFLDDIILTPAEAWNIDVKMDDGLPAKGSVQSWPGCSTINDNSDDSGLYLNTSTTKACGLFFKSQ